MNHFLPRRVLAVVFSALLGVLAFSCIAPAPHRPPTRHVEHDSISTMTIVDDEAWPSRRGPDLQPRQRGAAYVWPESPRRPPIWRCAGNEVNVLVRLKVELHVDRLGEVTARANLYEGQACYTGDLDGASGSISSYIGRGVATCRSSSTCTTTTRAATTRTSSSASRTTRPCTRRR